MTSLKADILRVVTAHPELDDEEIAAICGLVPFQASVLLRELEADGKILRASEK